MIITLGGRIHVYGTNGHLTLHRTHTLLLLLLHTQGHCVYRASASIALQT